MDTIFCPHCGAQLGSFARLCPSCHELLPAPATVLGYPADPSPALSNPQPDTSDVDGQAPPTDPAPVLFPPKPLIFLPADSTLASAVLVDARMIIDKPSAPEPVRVSPMARSYPNPDTDMGRAAAAGIPLVISDLLSPQAGPSGAQPAAGSPGVQPSAIYPAAQPAAGSPGVQPCAIYPAAQLPVDIGLQATFPSARSSRDAAPLPPPQASGEPSAPIPNNIAVQVSAQRPPQPASQGYAPLPAPGPSQVNASLPQQDYAQAPVQVPSQQPGAGPSAAFVYGAPVDEKQQAAWIAPSGTSEVKSATRASQLLAPCDTPTGLRWRAIVGGALLTWGILLFLVGSAFVVLHATILLRHGWWNAHQSLHATCWISIASLVPSAALLSAGASWLSGRGWPRALAFASFVTGTLWAGVCISVLAIYFHRTPSVIWSMVAAGATWLCTALCMVFVLLANPWMARRPVVGAPRAVPYPLWAGPVMIVLGSLAFVRTLVPSIGVLVKMNGVSQFWREAREAFTTLQVWGGALALCLISLLVIASAIGVLRRKRWAVALGGIAGIAALLTLIAVSTLVFLQHQTYRYGGVANLPFAIWVMGAHGIGAWIALAGALRFRFRLPTDPHASRQS